MMLKKGFKRIRSAAMDYDSSVYNLINIDPCNFQNLIRRRNPYKIPSVCSSHNKL